MNVEAGDARTPAGLLLARITRLAGTRLATAALALAATLGVANLLGVAEFGSYATFLNALIIFSAFGKWGWDGASVRFVAANESSGDRATAKAFSSYALRRVMINCAFVGVVLLIAQILLWQFAQSLSPNAWLLPCAAAVLPFYAAALLGQGVLRGQRRPLTAEVFESLLKPALVVVSLYLVLQAGAEAKAFVAVALYGIVSVASSAITWRAAQRRWVQILPHEVESSLTAEWSSATRAHGFVNFCQIFVAKTPVLVAASLLSPAEAGLLAVAIRVSESLQIGMTAIGVASAPDMAALFHQRRIAELRKTMRASTTASLIVAIGGGVVLAVIAQDVLTLFGRQFAQATTALIVLLCAQALNAAFGPVGYLATMSGQQAAAAKVYFFSSILALPLLIAGAHVAGMMGLTFAYCLLMIGQSAAIGGLMSRTVLATREQVA